MVLAANANPAKGINARMISSLSMVDLVVPLEPCIARGACSHRNIASSRWAHQNAATMPMA